MSEADWPDSEFGKALIVRVDDQVLVLQSHELGSKPGLHKFPVWRDNPRVRLVPIGVLELDFDAVGLDFRQSEELFIDVLIRVSVRTSQIVGLADALLHLNCIEHGESDIIREAGLHFSVGTLNDEVHSVEHLHLHAPLADNCRIRVYRGHHVSGTEDRHVRERFLDFLLTDPLRPKPHALGVRVSTSGRDMNQSLDIWVGRTCFSDSHRHSDVGVLKFLLRVAVNTRANTVDDDVLFADHMSELVLVSEVIELHICFVAQIGSWLDLLEDSAPNARLVSVGIDDSRADLRHSGTDGHAQRTSCAENGSIDTRQTVAAAFVIDVHPLQLVVTLARCGHEQGRPTFDCVVCCLLQHLYYK